MKLLPLKSSIVLGVPEVRSIRIPMAAARNEGDFTVEAQPNQPMAENRILLRRVAPPYSKGVAVSPPLRKQPDRRHQDDFNDRQSHTSAKAKLSGFSGIFLPIRAIRAIRG